MAMTIYTRTLYFGQNFILSSNLIAPSSEVFEATEFSKWKKITGKANINVSLMSKTNRGQDNILKITMDTVEEVVHVFKSALNWFYEKEYDQLFLYDSNNELQLNPTFIDLRTSSRLKSIPIVIAPCVVPTEDNMRYTYGVAVCMMTHSNVVLMSLRELSGLHSILSRLSFSDEIVALLLLGTIKSDTGTT